LCRVRRSSAVFPALLRRPLAGTLLPYTTLFRSSEFIPGHPLAKAFVAPCTEAMVRALVDELGIRDVIECYGMTEIPGVFAVPFEDRKSTRLNSSHVKISYAVFCLKKKKTRAVRS